MKLLDNLRTQISSFRRRAEKANKFKGENPEAAMGEKKLNRPAMPKQRANVLKFSEIRNAKNNKSAAVNKKKAQVAEKKTIGKLGKTILGGGIIVGVMGALLANTGGRQSNAQLYNQATSYGPY